jgi:TolA-binding protein
MNLVCLVSLSLRQATDRGNPWVIAAAIAAGLLVNPAFAQDTQPPIAQPVAPMTSPVALPVDQPVPPIAQPVAPATPPVAQPVDQPAPLISPATANPTTNAAPISGPDAIVVTTPGAARFESAMVFFNAGQYADAVPALSDFIRDFPQDRRREEALYRLAESYRKLGRADDALAAYTFQVQTYPEGPLRITAELHRGAILFDQNKFADAIAPLRFVADKGDGELQDAAKYFLGRSLLAMQKESEGQPVLQALVDQQPPGKFAGGAAQVLAELDDSENKYGDALVLWQKAFTLFSDPALRAIAAARGGWSALQAKQPAVAEKLFQTARQLDAAGDARKVANTGLLRILFEKKRYAEWIALYGTEKDKLLDSAHSEVLYDLGQAQFSLKHWPEAVAGFDQYLQEFGTQSTAVTAAYERFLALAQIDRTRTVTEAEAYQKAWPQSPYRARVQLLEAQEWSREKNFTAALPLWESLAKEPAATDWPRQDILLELARTYDELSSFSKAAIAYRAYLDDLAAHPNGDKATDAKHALRAQARLAICLQKSDQLLAATDAWKTVESIAPDGSHEQETALESLGLIYARGGPEQETAMVATFRTLLDKFPQSPLRAMAAFSVGDSLFKARDYAGAEPDLLDARNRDAKTWLQPATQRLVLGAYGRKDYDKTVAYLKEYETIPQPTDAQARIEARIPAAVFYWLAQTAQKAGNWDEAEDYYLRVTQHPDPGDLLAGAWWQLGEVQGERKEWPAAVSSYEKYRQLKPTAKDATTVLLAEGRAELGAQNFAGAKKLGEQALLQEPEGPHSAASRMLLGETAFAAQNYSEAARMFGTLAVLFDDAKMTPQAVARAADAFEKAGDAKSATEWRQKLKDKYPGYQESSYL